MLFFFEPRSFFAPPALVSYFLLQGIMQTLAKGEYPIPKAAPRRNRVSDRRRKPARLRK